MESCGSEKCRVEWEKIPGEEGSQVHCTMLLRDCGDEVNRMVILLHTAIHRCPALHCTYRQTGPCVGGSNLQGESLYLLSTLSLSAASESTAPAAPSGNPVHASAGGEGHCRIDVAARQAPKGSPVLCSFDLITVLYKPSQSTIYRSSVKMHRLSLDACTWARTCYL